MQRLVYRSMAAPATGTADVFKIIETSARRNPAREVTGFLLYDQDRFLQLLEGPAASIDALMLDIEADTRHHSVEVVDRADAGERLFPDWSMKRLVSFDSRPALEDLKDTLRGKAEGGTVLDLVNGFLND